MTTTATTTTTTAVLTVKQSPQHNGSLGHTFHFQTKCRWVVVVVEGISFLWGRSDGYDDDGDDDVDDNSGDKEADLTPPRHTLHNDCKPNKAV